MPEKKVTKPAVKKAAPKKETATTKKVEKKPVAKKAVEKKAVEKKAVEKKPAVKKTAVKKVTAKKETAGKKSVQDYIDVINWKKWEAHNMDWLYIEINAGDLLTELEAGVDNLTTACKAIMDCMLEGDGFIVEPKKKAETSLTVRYYCDNLSEDRKKYSK